MDLMPHLVILGVLVLMIVVFLWYRHNLTAWEDDTIHVHEGEENIVETQKALAKKLGKVDLIGKILIGVTVVYAIAVGAVWSYPPTA